MSHQLAAHWSIALTASANIQRIGDGPSQLPFSSLFSLQAYGLNASASANTVFAKSPPLALGSTENDVFYLTLNQYHHPFNIHGNGVVELATGTNATVNYDGTVNFELANHTSAELVGPGGNITMDGGLLLSGGISLPDTTGTQLTLNGLPVTATVTTPNVDQLSLYFPAHNVSVKLPRDANHGLWLLEFSNALIAEPGSNDKLSISETTIAVPNAPEEGLASIVSLNATSLKLPGYEVSVATDILGRDVIGLVDFDNNEQLTLSAYDGEHAVVSIVVDSTDSYVINTFAIFAVNGMTGIAYVTHADALPIVHYQLVDSDLNTTLAVELPMPSASFSFFDSRLVEVDGIEKLLLAFTSANDFASSTPVAWLIEPGSGVKTELPIQTTGMYPITQGIGSTGNQAVVAVTDNGVTDYVLYNQHGNITNSLLPPNNVLPTKALFFYPFGQHYYMIFFINNNNAYEFQVRDQRTHVISFNFNPPNNLALDEVNSVVSNGRHFAFMVENDDGDPTVAMLQLRNLIAFVLRTFTLPLPPVFYPSLPAQGVVIPSDSPTTSSSASGTPSITITPTPSKTPTPSLSPTPSTSATSSISFSVTITPTPSGTPSITVTPTTSATASKTLTRSPSTTPNTSPTPIDNRSSGSSFPLIPTIAAAGGGMLLIIGGLWKLGCCRREGRIRLGKWGPRALVGASQVHPVDPFKIEEKHTRHEPPKMLLALPDNYEHKQGDKDSDAKPHRSGIAVEVPWSADNRDGSLMLATVFHYAFERLHSFIRSSLLDPRLSWLSLFYTKTMAWEHQYYIAIMISTNPTLRSDFQQCLVDLATVVADITGEPPVTLTDCGNSGKAKTLASNIQAIKQQLTHYVANAWFPFSRLSQQQLDNALERLHELDRRLGNIWLKHLQQQYQQLLNQNTDLLPLSTELEEAFQNLYWSLTFECDAFKNDDSNYHSIQEFCQLFSTRLDSIQAVAEAKRSRVEDGIPYFLRGLIRGLNTSGLPKFIPLVNPHGHKIKPSKELRRCHNFVSQLGIDLSRVIGGFKRPPKFNKFSTHRALNYIADARKQLLLYLQQDRTLTVSEFNTLIYLELSIARAYVETFAAIASQSHDTDPFSEFDPHFDAVFLANERLLNLGHILNQPGISDIDRYKQIVKLGDQNCVVATLDQLYCQHFANFARKDDQQSNFEEVSCHRPQASSPWSKAIADPLRLSKCFFHSEKTEAAQTPAPKQNATAQLRC